jgi:arsenite methyltransferase
VNVVLGDATDPHLPPRVNAVLISNTYHEFSDSHSILVHVYEALVPAGRLVVVDREPHQSAASLEVVADHEILADRVQKELQQANFQIVHRQDRFVEHDPYGENWWLIAARKP